MKSEKLIVDSCTGEVITEVRPGDRVKITRMESIKALKAKREKDESLEEWKIEHYYKGNIKEINKWIKELSVNEKAFLFGIAPSIGWDDCRLAIDGKNMAVKDFMDVSGLSKSVTYRTIESLIKKDILYKGKNSKTRQYFINPWLFCVGNRVNKVLQAMFENYRIRILNGTKWGDLK